MQDPATHPSSHVCGRFVLRGSPGPAGQRSPRNQKEIVSSWTAAPRCSSQTLQVKEMLISQPNVARFRWGLFLGSCRMSHCQRKTQDTPRAWKTRLFESKMRDSRLGLAIAKPCYQSKNLHPLMTRRKEPKTAPPSFASVLDL